ncbi:MAG: CotH kinase family protein [Cytophagaceae bacterium]
MKKVVFRLVSAIFLSALLFTHSISQVIINEVSSNNSSYYQDEDGDYGDWIELFNAGSSAVNLSGYKLSDRPLLPAKWTFPSVSIPAGGYFTVYASGKNKNKVVDHWESVVLENHTWRYRVPTATIAGWTDRNFNDGSWAQGPAGIGYGDGDDATTVPSGTVSVFMRRTFNIADSAAIQAMILHMDYDDGFVAYLNGVEIARSNINGNPPAWNATAPVDREAQMYSGGTPEGFPISSSVFKPLLRNGANVLAIQIHNHSSSSSDLSAIPFLSVGVSTTSMTYSPTPSWFTAPANTAFLHTNFSLKASGETLYLFNPSDEVINTVVIPQLSVDDTYGRYPNGSSTFRILAPPTPNASNGSSTAFNGYLDATVSFSLPPGFYSGTQSVTCTCSDATALIRYTTDGSKPTASSTQYTGAISVSSSRVLRAACFKSGFKTRNFETNTYFINDAGTTLAVFSISTHPNNFFHNDTGIYVLGPNASSSPPNYGANFWQDWEREVHIEYFDKGKVHRFEQDCGIKIFGGWSRANAMKSLRLIPNSKYGENKIRYPLFSEKPHITEFDQVHLRNGGNDFNYTHLRDQTNNRILNSNPEVLGSKTNIDFSAYEPVAVFINGQYWGVHHLRERYNHGYFEWNHNVSKGQFEMLEMDGDVVKESDEHFVNMTNFIENNTMSTANYNQVKQWLDVENYVDYMAAQIYHTNWDWPHNNIKYWRKTAGGKWRYLYYDTDFSYGLFGFTENSPTFNELNRVINDTRSKHSPMFKKLLTNTEFRNYFVNRFADLMNTVYRPANMKGVFDGLKAELDPEMTRHFNRWPQNAGSVTGWNSNCSGIRTWMDSRPTPARNHIISQFGLVKTVNVTLQVNPAGAGVVQISTITPSTYPWTGTYFDGVPVTITAYPNPGYAFANWTSSSVSVGTPNSASITLNIGANNTFTANFTTTTNIPRLTISEINYNSPVDMDAADWLELHNYGNASINLSGWVLKDENEYNSYKIPPGTILAPGQYLVLVSSVTKFTGVHPGVSNFIGPFDFNLSNAGEQIRLYDNLGRLNLSMTYADVSPWPLYADGKGSTLELIDPTGNLSDGSNWKDGCKGGSPGSAFTPCPCMNVDLGPDKILCSSGGTVTLNTGLTAHVNRKFNWYFNGTLIAAATGPTFNSTAAGEYYVVVDSMGCLKTDAVSVKSDLTFSLGDNFTLCTPSVRILSSGLDMPDITNVWRKDGNIISGETSATLRVNSPGTYQLTVSAPGCSSRSSQVVVNSAGPIPNDNSRCGSGTVSLSVTGTKTYEWYSVPTGGSVLTTGNNFTTPILTTTTTYYVRDASFFNGIVGPSSPSEVGGSVWTNSDWSSSTNEYKMRFNVLAPVVLDAITVFTNGPQNVTIRVLQPDKSTIRFTRTVAVTTTGESRIPLNFEFVSTDVKNGYFIDAIGTTGQLRMNGSGATTAYPYLGGGKINITGAVANWGSINDWYPYFYKWEYSSGPGPCDRVPVVATINAPAAAAGPISGSTTACSSSSGNTYSITPVPGATSYTWTVPSGSTITNGSGTNSITVTFGSTSGTISVTPVSPCGNGGSSSISVTLNPAGASASVTISGPNSVCQGQGATFTANPVNGGTPTYQWRKNGVNISGATSSTYNATGIVHGDVFSVIMTSSLTCVTGSPATSNSITVTVNPNVTASVSITASATTICSGSSVTFTANPVNGGSTPTYQWRRNGINISGATGSQYTTSSLSDNDQISVLMTSNSSCVTGSPATSNVITMTVNTSLPVSVSVAPDANPVCQNQPVVFTATPTNGGPGATYQWRRNGVNIPGATLSTFSASSVTHNDVYSVIMTSSLECASGSPATSNNVVMTVNNNLPASVTISPSANPACAGQAVTFTATPSNGGSAPTYEWRRNGSLQSGATQSTFTISTLNDGDIITCVMHSSLQCVSGSPATSNGVIMTINSSQPASVSITSSATSICTGQSVTFNATPVNGGTSPAYQWLRNGSEIASATGVNFTSSTLANGDQIAVRMTSNSTCATGSPATSAAITMTVNAYPSASITAGGPTTFCAGGTVSLSANTGTGLSYQWKNGGVNIASATSANYSANATGNYTVEVTRNGCSTTSTPVTVTVTPQPSTANAGADQNVCGSSATLNGNMPSVGTGTWTKVSGNGTIVDPSNANSPVSGLNGVSVFRWTISNGTCPVSHDEVSISSTGSASAEVVINASANPVCQGQSVTFTATPVNGGTSPIYQWRVNGSVVGSNSNIYTASNLSNGDNVQVTMTSDLTCVTGSPANSNTITMTVNTGATASVSITSTATSICAGQSVTFNATPTNGGTAPVYQWLRNGTEIASATGLSYTSTSLVNADQISVRMTSNATCATSSPATSSAITMTVTAYPTATITAGGPTTFCAGGSVSLEANTGTGLSYQWKNGGVNIPSATAATYSATTSGNYSVEVTRNGCATSSTAVTVTATPQPTTADAGADQTVCGTTTTLNGNTPAVGTGVWTKISGNGTITDASSPTTTVTGLSGTAMFRWTISNGNCTESFDEITVNVTATAPAEVYVNPSANPVCQGQPVTFTAVPVNGGTSPVYQWSINGNVVGTNSGTYTASNLSSGDQVRVTMTSNLSCSTGSPANSNIVTMVVNASQAASVNITSSASTICQGQSVTFTANPTNGGSNPGFQWYRNGVSISSATDISYTSTSLANGDQIYVQMTSDATCATGSPATSNIVTATVTAYPLAQITASGSASFCEGSGVTLNANSGTGLSYVWKRGPEVVSASGSGYFATQGGNYTVDVTSNGCTSTSSPFTVYVNPSPSTANAGTDQSICSGSTTLDGNVPQNGSGMWTVISGVGNVIDPENPKSAVTGLSGITVLRWTVSNGPCSPSSDEVTINASQGGQAEVYINVSANPVCNGQSVSFTAISFNGGSTPQYSWRVNDVVIGETSHIYTTTSLVNGDRVQVVMTSDLSCASGSPASSNVITMTVNPSPQASVSISASGTEICPGETVSFWATTVNGGSLPSFQWMKNGIEIPGANFYEYATANISNGDVFSVRMTSSFTCVSNSPANSNQIAVTLNSAVAMSVDLTSSSEKVCQGNPVTFTALPKNAGSSPQYSWKVNGMDAGTNNSQFTSSSLQNGDEVYVVVSSASACVIGSPSSSNRITITVDASPTVANAGADQSITVNYTTLNANIPTVGSGMWTQVAGAGFISSPGSPSTNVGALSIGNNIYRWTISNGICPPSIDEVIVAYGSHGQFFISGPTTVNANETHTYTVSEVSGASYNWILPEGATIITGQGTNSVTIYFGPNASGTLTVIQNSLEGEKTASAEINVITSVDKVSFNEFKQVFPNPFFGKTHILIGTQSRERVSIQVTNMLGIILYTSDDHFTNETIEFGEKLAAGEYIVHASYGDRVQTFKIIKFE